MSNRNQESFASIVVQSIQEAEEMIYYLFSKYGDQEGIQEAFPDGLELIGPDTSDNDHDKAHHEHRYLLVVEPRKK